MSQIKSSAEYTAAKNDGIALLKIINKIMNNFEEFQYLGEGVHDMIKTFSLLKWDRNESMPRFHAQFPCPVSSRTTKSWCDIVSYLLLEKYAVDPKSPTDAEYTAAFEREQWRRIQWR